MRTCVALFALWCAGAAAGGADDISVEALRRGSAVHVSARATLDAPLSVIWGTLTDFDRLAEFIPGMSRSRLLERRGNQAVVEQAGEARFLFFTFPIDVTLLSTARPPESLEVRALKGNLRRLDGGYRIEPAPDGRYLLRWTGIVEPESALPPLLGTAVMRACIEDQFTGMVREIERREALRRKSPP
ncbi:MAG: SRPBCC family protein [Burkholderiales bacterium]